MSVKNARRTNTTGRQQNIAYYQAYVDGNTVRKLDVMPEERVKKAPKKQISKETRKAREKAFQINYLS